MCGPDRTGLKPKGEDGSHLNTVVGTSDNKILITGDDFGLVNVFNCPNPSCDNAHSYAGHSEHVKRVAISKDGQNLFSMGG